MNVQANPSVTGTLLAASLADFWSEGAQLIHEAERGRGDYVQTFP